MQFDPLKSYFNRQFESLRKMIRISRLRTMVTVIIATVISVFFTIIMEHLLDPAASEVSNKFINYASPVLEHPLTKRIRAKIFPEDSINVKLSRVFRDRDDMFFYDTGQMILHSNLPLRKRSAGFSILSRIWSRACHKP